MSNPPDSSPILDTDAEPIKSQITQQPGALKSFIAGGVGGMALVIVGQPLDTIKVRIQTMPTPAAGQPPMYNGVVDCAFKSMKAEGPLALYKGMSAPLAGVTPMYALCFLGYGVGKSMFCTPESFSDPTQPENLARIGAAGAVSALFTTPILAPGERAKCVLQTQGKSGKFNGPVDVWKHLYREGGIASVNRGFLSTLARDGVASFFYFSTYEFLKYQFTQTGESSPSVAGTLTAGGLAGILNWAGALPIDTLKSRLQIAPEGKYKHGIRSVFKEVMANEGIGALYKGFTAVMLRAFPANAACFYAYELALKGMNKVSALDGY